MAKVPTDNAHTGAGTHPSTPTETANAEEFNTNFRRDVRIKGTVDDAVSNVVYSMTKANRENTNAWDGIITTALYQFMEIIEDNPDFKDMGSYDILEKYDAAFRRTMVICRFTDYCDDFKVKNIASEPSEPTNIKVDIPIYKKYFDKIDPYSVSYILSSCAEGCVRNKLTHRADAIVAFCKIAAFCKMDELHDLVDPVYAFDDLISNAKFYADETHYMADNPAARMRFDDN